MTINEIKNELESKIAQLQSVSLGLQDSGELTICFTILQRLNQLSAPELVWNAETDKCYSSTPVKLLQYNIQEKLDPDNAFFLYFNTRFQEWFETMEEAKAAAQAHWNELYKQIINL